MPWLWLVCVKYHTVAPLFFQVSCWFRTSRFVDPSRGSVTLLRTDADEMPIVVDLKIVKS